MSRVRNKIEPTMNVTPLVDVVLVLLIIFMVVIPAMQTSATVELPSIFNVDAEAKSKTDPFTLSLTTSGMLYLEQEPLERDSLLETLREANRREPARRLMLRADRGAKYGVVRDLFKACQDVGFPGVSLKVNELEKPKAGAR
jgi:biopolymer transport protein TolR